MIKGYKGFNKDLQCTPSDKTFQYEVGKEYEEETAECCKRGFHFCENPLDVLRYYSAADNRFCEVEGDGKVSRNSADSKVAVSKIKIGAEITLGSLIRTGVKYITSKIDWRNTPSASSGYRSTAASSGYRSTTASSGDYSTAASSGDYSTATSSGDHSIAASSGDCSTANVTGKESLAVSLGMGGTAKGELGCWIELVDWRENRKGEWHIKDIKIHKVDGKSILPNVAYKLQDGKFVEA